MLKNFSKNEYVYNEKKKINYVTRRFKFIIFKVESLKYLFILLPTCRLWKFTVAHTYFRNIVNISLFFIYNFQNLEVKTKSTQNICQLYV